jgi:hypothetical protein
MPSTTPSIPSNTPSTDITTTPNDDIEILDEIIEDEIIKDEIINTPIVDKPMDNNDIIVREYNVLIDPEYCGKITSLQEFEIIKDHYYFYTNEVDVIDTKIKWLEKEIKREEKLREFYLEYKDMDLDKLKECLWGPK